MYKITTNKIFAIAINDYDDQDLNKIENCQKDVDKMLEILTTKYQFDDIDYIHTKEDTTRRNLFNKLNLLFANSLDSDSILLIYAGHGEYNPILDTAYWQPSDSDPKDFSTWLSLNELMTFVKASKAFHISIISDSCFSGAMFEPQMRGGGTHAFQNKKSRLGLTSGSNEKVSDGKKGDYSPFAKTLIEILSENKNKEYPFIQLGTNVLSRFSSETKQTPMFMPLLKVGHEGGSFVFRLKEEKIDNSIIVDKNSFVSKKMGSLYIKIQSEHLNILDRYYPFNEKKIEAVNNQNFELAASFREKEKNLLEIIYQSIPDYIKSLISDSTLDVSDVSFLEKIKSEIEYFETELEEKKDPAYISVEEKYSLDETFNLKYLKESVQISTSCVLKFAESNPSHKIMDRFKPKFIELYEENILLILNHIQEVNSIVNSKWISNKIVELEELILNIYKFEIGILSKSYYDKLEEKIDKKEIEISILNWMKNK